MQELLIAIGLVFVIEGLVWALFPQVILQFIESVSKSPDTNLRIGGAAAVAFGVLVVWLVHG